MAATQTANVGLGLSNYSTEATTPTTPRAPIPPSSQPAPAPTTEDSNTSAPNTPTNANFAGVTGQRPLPTSPFSNSFPTPQKPGTDARPDMAHRGDSHQSVQSTESQDVDMEDEDGEDVGSDDESVDAEGRPSKKKKGQRFFCTDYPPCKLSFTRSEHLARHIRYVKGEPSKDFILRMIENTLERGHSNATARADFPGSTICANMHRPFMSMKRFLATPWLRPALVSNARFEQIE